MCKWGHNRLKFWFCISVFVFASIAFSQEPEKLELGVYVNRIDALDIKTGTAVIDFWLWGRRNGNSKPILATLEISNGQVHQTGEIVKKQLGDLYYEAKRYSATIVCKVDLKKFPFDKQTLKICIEDSETLVEQMVFNADVRNSRFDPSWHLNEWDITALRCFSDEHLYPTSFGDPDVGDVDGSSSYSRFNIEIDLTRSGNFIQKCFKYFWAIFISIIVGLGALWIRVTDLDARFGMAVGSLFANVGCSYIIADKLPDSPELTIAELFSYMSLGVIVVLLLESIISLQLCNHGKCAFSKWLDRWSFWAVLIAYCFSVIWILHGAF